MDAGNISDRVVPLETRLREHFAKLGIPDDLAVFEATNNAVSFRHFGQLVMRNTVRLIRSPSQVCLFFFEIRTRSKQPDPQITFGRKECYASLPEALDALIPHLNPMIRVRKSFNFSTATAVRADTPLAAWDLYRTHVGTRDFTRAHSLLTGAAATHYGKMQALSGASKIVKLFPDAIGFEKDNSYSRFVDFHGVLVPYEGEQFEIGKLLFQNEETKKREAKQDILMVRTGQFWRISFMPWNLGKRIR